MRPGAGLVRQTDRLPVLRPARKTSGFLVVAPSRLAEAKCRTETRCGNDRQLAGCAASFLTELCQPLGCNMNPERSCCPMVGGGAWPCRQLYPSHPPCAGLCDLASVSLTVRSFSKSLRRTPPPVSTNVRWKPSLIARRGVHHCAPLQIGIMGRLLAIVGRCQPSSRARGGPACCSRASAARIAPRASGRAASRWPRPDALDSGALHLRHGRAGVQGAGCGGEYRLVLPQEHRQAEVGEEQDGPGSRTG